MMQRATRRPAARRDILVAWRDQPTAQPVAEQGA